MLSEYRPVDFPSGCCCRVRGPLAIQAQPVYHLQKHDCLEIGFCHSGQAIYIVDGQPITAMAGDVTFIDAELAHYGHGIGPSRSLWSWIFVDLLSVLAFSGTRGEMRVVSEFAEGRLSVLARRNEHPRLNRWVEDVLSMAADPDTTPQLGLAGLLLAILDYRIKMDKTGPLSPGSRSADKLQRLRPAVDYIRLHFADDLTIPQLADMCCTSPSNLWRWFRISLHMSPQQYLQLVRVQAATGLLRNQELAIRAIATQVGYPTLSSFNRAFRQVAGVAPHQWRSLNRI